MEGFMSHAEQSSLPCVTLPQLSCLRPAFSPHSTRHPNLFVSLECLKILLLQQLGVSSLGNT